MQRYIRILRSQSRAIELAFLLIAVAGFFAFGLLPSNVYPELYFPRIMCIASAGDMNPSRVVVAVTRPLEEAVSQVYNVRWVRSKSIRGSSEISIEFQDGTNMQLALQQLQQRIAEARATLPPDTNLIVERVTPAIFPVITYNVSSPTLTLADLRTYCRYQIQPALTRVAGVARVEIQGGDTQQIVANVDPAKLQYFHVSLADVVQAVQKANQEQIVGKLNKEYLQNLVVATGQSIDPAQLEKVVVASKPDAQVLLRDVGKVSWGIADRTKVISVNGRTGISLNIFRQPNSNVVEVSKLVAAQIHALKSKLPPGFDITPCYDESGLVLDAMNNVRDAILLGIGMIVVVLFLFLREWRSTLIAAISIPLCALAAFGIAYLFGQSLNLMSLGGIAVAIGLVIDDAVVVVENIDHQLRRGLDTFAAVTTALQELIVPVVSSTVTTVVVFLPLGLLSGVAGQFFMSFTVTLAVAVIFSLLLSLTLTPMLAARWLPVREPARNGDVNRHYERLVKGAFQHPILMVLVSALMIACAIFFGTKLPSDFLPAMDEGSYIIDYAAPPGTSLPETDHEAHEIEDMLAKDPDVLSWTRRTGAESGLFATQINTGDIQVVLKPIGQRHRSIWQIFDDQRAQVQQSVPQLDIDFHQILQDQLNDLSGVSSPIEVKVYGSDPAVLRSISSKIEDAVTPIHGLVDVVRTGKEGAPEIVAQVNPVLAAKYGLSTADVIAQMQDAMLGGIATQIRRGDRLIDVRVKYKDQVRDNANKLAQLPIVGPNAVYVPLEALAQVKTQQGEGEIRRENQERYVSVQTGVEKTDLGTAVRAVTAAVKPIAVPRGYSVDVGGISVAQKQAFIQILEILALDVMLVYLVLLIQFRSWKQPLAIFIAVPLALFGVIVSLTLTNTPLNVSSLMGMILLIGLVVKNGIILLDYTNRLREHEHKTVDEALVIAGSLRLRPILMTTLCTLLGLFPLALGFGAGSELQKPLAIAVIGGLCLSTLFTLIFMPVIYRGLERPHDRVQDDTEVGQV